MRRSLRTSGPADPALAWERYADPQRWSTWSPQIASVSTSTPRLETGTTGVVRGHGGLALDFVAESVDEAARRWTWAVVPRRAGGLPLPGPLQGLGRLRLEHAVLVEGTGCATTLVVDGTAPVVLAYSPLALLALRRLVR